MSIRTLALAVLPAVALISTAPANATNFSFTGNFSNDAEVQFFDFSVGSTSNVTFVTYSYAGGTNSAGASIARGGFDPILAVFDGAGNLIDQNDDGAPGTVPTDISGAAFDTFLMLSLGAGNYHVAVMQYRNFAIGPTLAEGFEQSSPTFTSDLGYSSLNCTQTMFCDVSNLNSAANRDSHWAFDILNVDTAVVIPNETPLPAALPLFATGIGALGWGAFRRRRKS